jgi:uncharacterized phage protein (TIGR02218 family)
MAKHQAHRDQAVKTIPSGLASDIAQQVTSIATAILITRQDSSVFAFTSASMDSAPISGVTYKAFPGLIVSDIVISADAAVGNLELTTLDDGTVFTTADILNGVWRNAAFTIFRYNYNNQGNGIVNILSGTFGEVRLLINSVIVELRDLRQYLQQAVGDASSKTCRARLGDARCKVNLASFTFTGTLTAVTSGQVFADTGAALQADDYYGEGQVTMTSGACSGLTAKVKSYASGVFTLALPFATVPSVGDHYTAIAGCRKRHDRTTANPSGASDCLDKFNNVLNFVGEPHRANMYDLTKPPLPSV